MRQPGGLAGPVDHPGDRVPIEGGAVRPRCQQWMIRRHELRPVLIDQRDQLRVQRQVAVVVEFADRHVQPGCGTDLHDRITAEAGELADPQTGAKQHFHRDSHQQLPVRLGGAQQSGGGRVVERLGQRSVLAGQVAGEHRHPGWCVVPAPLLDADEEHAQRPESVRDRRGGDARLVLPGTGGQPRLVVLDVSADHVGDGLDVGSALDEERGERPQRHVGVDHAARTQDAPDLLQVTAHRGDHLGRVRLQPGPAGQCRHPVVTRPVHLWPPTLLDPAVGPPA